MAETALDLLWTRVLSSFLLNGFQVFSPGKGSQNMKVSAQHIHLHPQKQKYSTTKVKSSWLVDKASLHIDIILLFQNLNLEIGLQPSPKLVWTSHQKATHIYFCIHQEEHWTWSGLWNCPPSYSIAIRFFSSAKTSDHEAVRSAYPTSTPESRSIPQPKSRLRGMQTKLPSIWTI